MPSPSDREDFENPLDIIPLVEKTKAIKKFLSTRKAILANERLSNLSQKDLKERGLLGPWAFNAAQSVIDSIPAMFVAGYISLVWPTARVPMNPLETVLDPNSASLANPLSDPLKDKIVATLAPLAGPLSFLVIVYVVAYACLPSKYLTKRNWRAAQRRYLYSDGAHNLWTQFLFALAIALLQVPATEAAKHRGAAAMLLSGKILFCVSFLWVSLYTTWRVQADLFYYDYLSDRPEKYGSIRGPSMFKFFGLTCIALPIALNVLAGVFDLIATGLAELLHHFL